MIDVDMPVALMGLSNFLRWLRWIASVIPVSVPQWDPSELRELRGTIRRIRR